MKIKSLHLENYRCFAMLDIQFDESLTVIVGINGSGKTTILDALGLFLDRYAHNFYTNLNRDNIPQTDLRHGDDEAKLICAMNLNGELIRPSIILTRQISSKTVYVTRDDKKLLRLREEKFVEGNTYSIVTFYSGKRIVGNTNSEHATESTLTSAYLNAFSPQIDFSSSLSWFIAKASEEALEAVQNDDITRKLPELSAVRNAVSQALGDYYPPFVTGTPPKLFISPKGHPEIRLLLEQLSDGYRTMLALVMDLARRMAVANQHIKWPEGQSVLHSPGVVLIDEVELHLHPSWQQTVLPTLAAIFPNVQFIVTTHSPQVLTSISGKHIRILKDDKVLSLPEETEGAEASRVLEDVLGVSSRPPENPFSRMLNQYATLVYAEKWDSPEAHDLRAKLYEHYGDSEPKMKELDLHIENAKWEREL